MFCRTVTANAVIDLCLSWSDRGRCLSHSAVDRLLSASHKKDKTSKLLFISLPNVDHFPRLGACSCTHLTENLQFAHFCKCWCRFIWRGDGHEYIKKTWKHYCQFFWLTVCI